MCDTNESKHVSLPNVWCSGYSTGCTSLKLTDKQITCCPIIPTQSYSYPPRLVGWLSELSHSVITLLQIIIVRFYSAIYLFSVCFRQCWRPSETWWTLSVLSLTGFTTLSLAMGTQVVPTTPKCLTRSQRWTSMIPSCPWTTCVHVSLVTP